jgi:murein DD-endopeptidase MepM/ murein hydrolase activator NlpD
MNLSSRGLGTAVSKAFAWRGRRRLIGSMAAAALMGLSGPAAGETSIPDGASSVAANDYPSEQVKVQEGPPVRIRVGRALDFEGRPVYPSRTKFASAAITDFSTRRRRVASSSLGAPSLHSTRPLHGAAVTSGFGMRRHPLLGGRRMHSGIDLAAPLGSPILAASDGLVSNAGWRGGYGLLVSLEHANGLQTRYGHMSQLAVTAGQRVNKGEVIGYVGSTGRSTGPHLHYEMRVNGVPVNPSR